MSYSKGTTRYYTDLVLSENTITDFDSNIFCITLEDTSNVDLIIDYTASAYTDTEKMALNSILSEIKECLKENIGVNVITTLFCNFCDNCKINCTVSSY